MGVAAWQLAAAAVTGFIAKENVVGTLAVCFVGLENLIDTDELMDLLSLVRLGAVKGLINIDTAKIEGMMINLQPATISLSVDRPLDRNGRDALRAQRVREMLG